jgi:xanthine/CO dehydrogenase XdhC/CoxF family maturation factor
MSNHLNALLSAWFAQRDSCQWVLATIIETQRSSYRKRGAMMFINSLGQTYGLLSGGCLETDLMQQAQKCWLNNTNITVSYDMQDDSDIAWQLGIGCGGFVKVLVQPIDISNNYLDLMQLKVQIDNRTPCYYAVDTAISCNTTNSSASTNNQVLESNLTDNKNIFTITPTPALVIFGGGVDSHPLVCMAHTLGWFVCLVDSRTAYARTAYFKSADIIINADYAGLATNPLIPKADAIVVMHHNILLDAKALQLTQTINRLSGARYIGILGPQHRTKKVLEQAKLLSTKLPSKLTNKLASPIGLDLGGDLPESIALAILAQAHAVIEKASAENLGFFDDETCTAIATNKLTAVKVISKHAN